MTASCARRRRRTCCGADRLACGCRGGAADRAPVFISARASAAIITASSAPRHTSATRTSTVGQCSDSRAHHADVEQRLGADHLLHGVAGRPARCRRSRRVPSSAAVPRLAAEARVGAVASLPQRRAGDQPQQHGGRPARPRRQPRPGTAAPDGRGHPAAATGSSNSSPPPAPARPPGGPGAPSPRRPRNADQRGTPARTASTGTSSPAGPWPRCSARRQASSARRTPPPAAGIAAPHPRGRHAVGPPMPAFAGALAGVFADPGARIGPGRRRPDRC
jgi:hypothetical protein